MARNIVTYSYHYDDGAFPYVSKILAGDGYRFDINNLESMKKCVFTAVSDKELETNGLYDYAVISGVLNALNKTIESRFPAEKVREAVTVSEKPDAVKEAEAAWKERHKGDPKYYTEIRSISPFTAYYGGKRGESIAASSGIIALSDTDLVNLNAILTSEKEDISSQIRQMDGDHIMVRTSLTDYGKKMFDRYTKKLYEKYGYDPSLNTRQYSRRELPEITGEVSDRMIDAFESYNRCFCENAFDRYEIITKG